MIYLFLAPGFEEVEALAPLDLLRRAGLSVTTVAIRTAELNGHIQACGHIGTTAANLAAAAEGEYDEWHRLYPGFAEIARQEGFSAIAEVFDAVCVSERHHEKRYRELLKHVEANTVFCRKEPVIWKCRNCGYLHTGTEAPGSCPACAHDRAYFELYHQEW